MSIITPELVEKAWQAGRERVHFDEDWDRPEVMQAALTAILPDILEAACQSLHKTAEPKGADWLLGRSYLEGYSDGLHDGELAIRALAQTQDET